MLETLYTDKRQTWKGDVRDPRWAKAFLKMAGLFWLPYHKKKILCKLKQRNSWTGDKQISPAIVWQLSTATSAVPLHFFLLNEIGSVSLCNSRYLIYYWFTIRFPCLKSAYKYASLTIKLTFALESKTRKNSRFMHKLLF